MALDGQIELTISDAILNETVGILCGKFHRTPEQLRGDEAYIAACAKHVSPAEIIEAVPADPDDNRVLECAVAAGSDVIVTGDKHLLALGSFCGIDIVRYRTSSGVCRGGR
jgi:putative PIN family toxin of toxin-antitoxin system